MPLQVGTIGAVVHKSPNRFKKMIPTIGIMIGFYIITKMIEIDLSKGNPQALRTFAKITGVITLLCMLGLLSSSGGA